MIRRYGMRRLGYIYDEKEWFFEYVGRVESL
jgi:hypothetical protein